MAAGKVVDSQVESSAFIGIGRQKARRCAGPFRGNDSHVSRCKPVPACSPALLVAYRRHSSAGPRRELQRPLSSVRSSRGASLGSRPRSFRAEASADVGGVIASASRFPLGPIEHAVLAEDPARPCGRMLDATEPERLGIRSQEHGRVWRLLFGRADANCSLSRRGRSMALLAARHAGTVARTWRSRPRKREPVVLAQTRRRLRCRAAW